MKLALVTGSRRRLGGAIASALAQDGYTLAIHGSMDCEPEENLIATLTEAGANWQGFCADFSDPASATQLMQRVVDAFGMTPNLLVNNASRFGQDNLETVSNADLVDHFSINCAAPAMLTQALAHQRPEGHECAIVNVLDQRIAHPPSDQFAYTLSKLALAGLTKVAARTLAPHIRVNAVAPGLTIASGDYSFTQLESLQSAMPLHRLPTASEVAETVLFLAKAKSVSGQTIYVDAGAHMTSFERDFMYLEQ